MFFIWQQFLTLKHLFWTQFYNCFKWFRGWAYKQFLDCFLATIFYLATLCQENMSYFRKQLAFSNMDECPNILRLVVCTYCLKNSMIMCIWCLETNVKNIRCVSYISNNKMSNIRCVSYVFNRKSDIMHISYISNNECVQRAIDQTGFCRQSA